MDEHKTRKPISITVVVRSLDMSRLDEIITKFEDVQKLHPDVEIKAELCD